MNYYLLEMTGEYDVWEKYFTFDACFYYDNEEIDFIDAYNNETILKKYKIEQRFELGILFLQWLEKGLSNKNLLKNNPDFDTQEFISYIKSLGKEIGWFADEIDWSLDLDK